MKQPSWQGTMNTPSHSLKGEQESSGETGQGKLSQADSWQVQRQRLRTGTWWGASEASEAWKVQVRRCSPASLEKWKAPGEKGLWKPGQGVWTCPPGLEQEALKGFSKWVIWGYWRFREATLEAEEWLCRGGGKALKAEREEAGKKMLARHNMGLNRVNVSLAKEGVNGMKRWNRQGLEAYQMQGAKRQLAGVEVCSGVDLKDISAEATLPRVWPQADETAKHDS